MSARRLTLALVLPLTPLFTWCYHQVQTDDPYITFRYARNLLDGKGLLYNANEWVLGTTAPLHALVLALGGLFVDDLPLLASVINGASLAVLALLLQRLLAGVNEPWAGAAAAVLVVGNPLMGDAFGFELNLFLALTFGGIVAYFSGRHNLAALLLALGTLTRGDGAVPAALVFFYHLWRTKSLPVGPILIFVAICGGWGIYAAETYGSPFPNTLAAKRAMGDSDLWRPYWYGALRMPYLYLRQSPLILWFAVVGALGCLRLRRVDRKIWLVLGWMILVFVAYTAMDIPAASNYYAAMVPFLMIVVGLGLVEMKERFDHCRAGYWRQGWLPAALLVPLLLAQSIPVLNRVETNPDARYHTYRAAGEWLAGNTAQEASVGMVEIGMVGYFSDRRIVDVCGLVDPAVGPHLASGDVTWPLRHYSPDYILLHEPAWPSLEGPTATADWFAEKYEPVRMFAGEVPYRLALFRKR